MTTRTSIATIAIGMVLAVVVAPAAQAQAEQSPQAYQALRERSFALNVMYALDRPEGMTHDQHRASLIRSAALNERYGLPIALTSGEIARLYGTGRTTSPELAPRTSAPRGDAFDWGAAAIGAAFAAGLALMGAAGVLVLRRRALVPTLRH